MSKQKEQKTSPTPTRTRSNDKRRDLPKGFCKELMKHYFAKIDKATKQAAKQEGE